MTLCGEVIQTPHHCHPLIAQRLEGHSCDLCGADDEVFFTCAQGCGYDFCAKCRKEHSSAVRPIFQGILEKDSLKWSHGETWARMSAERIHAITCATEPGKLCQLMRSFGDSRDWDDCVLANCLNDEKFNFSLQAKCFPTLIDIVPPLEHIQRQFRENARQIEVLISEGRTK